MLLRYLKERFPTYAKAGDVDYDKVVATNVSTLVDPSPALDAFRGAVRAFLYMGAKMRGEDLDPLTQADAAVTGRAGGPDGLDVAVKTELEKRYANPTTLSEDFLRTLRRHPEIGIATLSNVDAVRTALQADRSMLGTAITQGVIDNAKLAPLCANAATNLTRRQQVVQGAAGREAEIRNQIETQQERGFVTKLAENFSNLDTWQKWVIGIVGGYLAYKFITRKREHGLDLWDAAVGLPVILYVFNGRKLLDGTIFGNLLNYPEGFVNDLGNKLNRGTGVTAQMNPERVRMYGQFFAEVARVEVKDELEAIEYLSSIAIGSVANSLTLSTNAMVGELNVRDTSPLVREIRRIYGEEVGDRILSKVRRMRTGLGTALPRVFYLLGGTDRPSDFHRIEDARRATPNQKYEELPDAEKQAYKQLVLHGQNLALTTYQGMSLYEVVGILLQKNA
jgi:hypothetical protein